MSILNVDKIQPIGGGSTITVDATDIQASTGTIRASTFSGDISATGIGVTSLNIVGVTTTTDDIKIDADNKNLKIGAGEDLSLFHNGTDSRIVNTTGDLSIRGNSLKLASTTGEEYVRCTANGSVDLFHDNVVKLTTNTDGYRSNDNVKAQFGNAADLTIFHDGTHSRIYNSTGNLSFRSAVFDVLNADGSERMFKATADSGCELFFNGNSKVQTRTGDTLFLDDIRIGDNLKINVGTLDDLQIFHDGSHNYILGATGDLILKNSTANYVKGVTSTGAVELSYGGNTRFSTTAQGVNATGISTFNAGNVNGITFPLNLKNDNNDADYDMGTGIKLQGGSDTEFYKWCAIVARGDNNGVGGYSNSQALAFYTYNNNGASGGTEKLRIDSSGRLIVGGGTHAGGTQVVIKGGGVNTYSTLGMYSNHTNPAADTLLSQIRFGSNATADGADIRAYADAAWGTNDYPTRLGFYTAPDGSNSRTEKLRIASTGMITLGNPTSGILKAEINNSVSGHYFVSQCDDNQNGFEIYQQHGSTATRNTFAVYDNRRGSKAESLLIRGDGVKITRSRGGNYARTYEFNYNDGAGGGVQTKNLATVANYNDTCSAVAEVTYVGVYGTANDYISSGHWICGVRRANSGSAWNQTAVEAAAGGNSGTSSLDIRWSSGVLQAVTVGAWMGWTVNVRITIINGDITVNV